jgi:hypothetical protein
MPSKSSTSTAQAQQLLTVRVNNVREPPVTREQLQNLLKMSKERLGLAEKKIEELRVALADERKNCRRHWMQRSESVMSLLTGFL